MSLSLKVRIAGLAGLLMSPLVQADFSIPGFELVHTVPVDTALGTADLRQPGPVWIELFDGAKSTIDIGQFYAVDHPSSVMDSVIERLEAAGKRGVKIRFLLEEKGIRLSEASTLERLRAIPNLSLRVLSYGQLSGGILHAKYMVVDGKQAFIGSQNFDWRSLEHIHETGLRITDAPVVSQVQAIFDQDWRAQAALTEHQPVPLPAAGTAPARTGNYLVASPQRYNPPGVGDSQLELPRLLSEAQHEVRVQLLDYAPLSYGPDKTRPYYAVIDNAVRAAAARGVSIKLMVSNWNTDALELPYLKSLAVLPNVQIKIVTLPEAKQGFIPYARVIHSKTLEIDGKVAWVGTSNWLGGYLDNSRNLEVVMRSETMARRIGDLHEQLWDGPYARALNVTDEYPAPHPGQH
ncbi:MULTISPECIES: phospholipase D-like domain-containing protein [unclassified Pseudomonas]|jgi:phosphatidylserine/phosphatidylglycerophosphate/cardiolipin synthase-like enzyme|uniref:phospholipase D-like domain-containing protein n=1 Tax=unclassified Pseudomonas TaxID=196821 RepID=UPI000C87ED06|nr:MULTISPECIES: phospholipase D-like domain-containing protein [unclassified Pseudomonas]PMX27289.1 phospholipase [Pseudomonas sp. GW460-12]PMX28295.1 phospholipase [Pseudomonas sp. MPR-R2A4]PMX32081.1 phospholipase [Pseudomonas sp. MPR-R2A7]PMX52230.1 phospholipase [Pseudomonas sp. MPR-R2A6]PMX81185.1 phospholipase [Pseudomonas sp. MPR-R2A3]